MPRLEFLSLKSLSWLPVATLLGSVSWACCAQEALGMSSVDGKTGKLAEGFVKQSRTLQVVKDASLRRARRDVSSEEELAGALLAAKTDEERKALLDANKQFVTVGLQRALINRGNDLVDRGSYLQAKPAYQIVIAIAQGSGSKMGLAAALGGLGNVYRLQGSYPEAFEHYGKSLKISEEMGDKAGVARTLNNIGIVHHLRGDYSEALEYHHKNLEIFEGLADKTGVARALNNIGNTHESQGDYAEALKYYHRSLKAAEEMGDKTGVSITLNNIGNIHQSRGDYARALEHYQKSLRVSEELGYKRAFGVILNNIGNVHRLQCNYTQALEHYNKGLRFAEEVGNRAGAANTLNNIGIVHHLGGDYARALEHHHKSLKTSEEIGDKIGVGITLNNIGNVHQSQGDYARALEHYQKSLSIREEIGHKDGVADTLANIGIVHHSRGEHARAVELADRAAAIAGQIDLPETLWKSRAVAGRAHRALGSAGQAREAFTDAIGIIEQLRSQVAGGEQQRQRFFEEKISPYQAMVDLLIDQNDPAQALTFAERAKARALLDVLQSGKAVVRKSMTEGEQAQEQKLHSELVALNAQLYGERSRDLPDQARIARLTARLQSARLQIEAFQTNLYAAHPELRIRRGEVQPITIKEAASLIPDAKTALLEYVVTENKTYLFVLTESGGGSRGEADLKVFTFNIKQKELAEQVERFRARLGNRDFTAGELGIKLYDILLRPARAALRGKTSLIIIPDGVLWELSFQALQPEQDRYLIEGSAISYAPSLTALREMVRRNAKRAGEATAGSLLLAFGNPAIGKETSERVKSVFMDEKLEPLPEAERQVKLLSRLYGAGRSKVYTRADAREETLKAAAGSYRILHLATHGILNDAAPMYSHVLLSQAEAGNKEDGMLEAWEIMNLDVSAEMVVLSACETARGRVGAGEGVLGLTWALFVAGCPTTVASQWKVEAESTTELMVEFHRNLRSKIENPRAEMTRAEALRRAALKLLATRQYRHPFYWAGFVIVGDGR